MTCRIQRDIRCKKAIVADPDLGDIKNSTVLITEEVLSDFDIKSVIAVKRRIYKGVITFSEEFFYDLHNALEIRSVHSIQFLGKSARLSLLLHQLLVSAVKHTFIASFCVIHDIPPMKLL